MKKILIIEDDKVLRENTVDFLKEERFEVLYAEDGMAGVQLAMKKLPDLILCDISLPVMDGYEFLRTIQQIKSTSAIPLIFLTAKSTRDDVRTGMQLGADDYITKPFDYEELLKSIQIRLAKREHINELNDEKFYALIDNPTVGTYIYRNEKFIYINDSFAKILGYPAEELKELTFEEVVTGQNKEDVLLKIHRCMKEIQSSVHLKFEAIHKENGSTFVEFYGTVTTYNNTICMIGNMVDISKNNEFVPVGVNNVINKDKLSKREIEVLQYISKGMSTAEIAKELFISQRTIDTHRASLLCKTRCKNTAELIMYSIRNRLCNIN